jgi:hypothetical protein
VRDREEKKGGRERKRERGRQAERGRGKVLIID